MPFCDFWNFDFSNTLAKKLLDMETSKLWHKFHYKAAKVFLILSLFYAMFGKGDPYKILMKRNRKFDDPYIRDKCFVLFEIFKSKKSLPAFLINSK